mgnify:CR=1 FL=1
MIDFLKDIAKQAGNEYASLVADGVEAVSYTHLTLPTSDLV